MSYSEQFAKLTRTEQIIRREENSAREKRLREREGDPLTEIHSYHEDLANQYDITLDELNQLLSNPKEWIAFVESKRPTPSTQFDDREDINEKHKTTRKSPHSGTVFDTSEWDPGFKYGAGGKK